MLSAHLNKMRGAAPGRPADLAARVQVVAGAVLAEGELAAAQRRAVVAQHPARWESNFGPADIPAGTAPVSVVAWKQNPRWEQRVRAPIWQRRLMMAVAPAAAAQNRVYRDWLVIKRLEDRHLRHLWCT